MCAESGTQFVINDRADIALLLTSALHVGQEDLPPADARRILGDDRLVGLSTHNETELVAAAMEPVDYLALGPIFATGSKLNPDPVVGLEELRRLRLLTPRPLVAIGGINRANATAVLAAGADSVAVIGDLNVSLSELRQRVEEWIRLTASPLT